MHHRVRLPEIAQPVIKPDVVVCRRGRRIMQNLARILAETARRLYRDENIAVERPGNQKIALVIKYFPRRFAPIRGKLRTHRVRQTCEKAGVLLRRQMTVSVLHLRRADEPAIIRRIVRQKLHERLAVLRNRRHRVSRVSHFRQQAAHAFRRIKPRRAADIRICRRIIMKYDSDFLVLIRLFLQERPLFRLRRQSRHALLHDLPGHFADVVLHPRRNGHAVNNAVKLR